MGGLHLARRPLDHGRQRFFDHDRGRLDDVRDLKDPDYSEVESEGHDRRGESIVGEQCKPFRPLDEGRVAQVFPGEARIVGD